MHKFLALIATPLVILAGCGGGSGTVMNGGGGGGGGGGGNQVIATPGPPNVESLTVDAGPTALSIPAVNTAFVTVTVCMPGTSTCQSIDHIEIDTGSIGLRILADATTTAPGAPTFSLNLPPVVDSSNNPLAECLEFADGFSWGSVNTADMKLPVSGESATNVIVHVIGATSAGDPAKANPTCVPLPGSMLVTENTVTSFGANGILGVGPFINDCQSTLPCTPLPKTCAAGGSPCIPGNSATYFSCPTSSSCAQTTASLQQQLPNPGVLFTKDNNGVIVELPAVGANGSAGPLNGGALVFGIGTESNNSMTGATKLPADAASGVVSATLNGSMYPNSYLDSGSNGNFFADSSLTSCLSPNEGFYCPSSPVNESATLQGTNGTVLAADFSVANADTLFMSSSVAFSNLGGTNSDSTSLDLGLPFFYGRNVFTGFENPGVTAPYFAY